MTRDTVIGDTPAASATSVIVGALRWRRDLWLNPLPLLRGRDVLYRFDTDTRPKKGAAGKPPLRSKS
jgi:hypothetical protein